MFQVRKALNAFLSTTPQTSSKFENTKRSKLDDLVHRTCRGNGEGQNVIDCSQASIHYKHHDPFSRKFRPNEENHILSLPDLLPSNSLSTRRKGKKTESLVS